MTSISRRKWAAAVIGVLAVGLTGSAVLAEGGRPLRVCLVSGSLEYKSNESLAEFQQYLEQNYVLKCSRAFMVGDREDHLPGLENLETCDVALLFTRRLKLSGKELERLKKYCQSGKPLVGVRTASHAVQTWLELDQEVLGGNYQGHHGPGEPVELRIVPGAETHETLKGVAPWKSAGSLYKNSGLSKDVEVLLTGAIAQATEPVAWTRTHKGGRVFYTSLGHPDDFGEESFRRMLANALFWAAERSPEPSQ